MGTIERELATARGLASSQTQMAPAAVPVVQTSPIHSQTVRDLLGCCRAWEPDVRILGNVRAGDAAVALEHLIKIETAAKLSCGLLWMTAEWRQGKTDAAYQALLESVGGSGSQGLRESIEAALAAGFEVDAPPGCYWPAEDDADDQCDAPPIGLRCTRSKGHIGPCAAVACPEDVDLVERGMQRLRETTNANASGFETESF